MKYALAILAISTLAGCTGAPTAPAVSAPVPVPLVATLTIKGDLVFEDVPAGYVMHATAVNTGGACAVDISGTTTIRSVIILSYEWSVPDPLVKPGASFTYTFGPMTEGEVRQVGTQGTYTTAFRFRSLPC